MMNSSASSIFPQQLLEFLNSLPDNYDPREWLREFRAALQKVLTDVDLISIDLNLDCDIHDPESYATDLAVFEHMETKGNKVSRRHITVMRKAERERTPHLLNQMKSSGFPLDRYHQPHSFEYMLAGKAYLATLLFFRERPKQPIPTATLDLISDLEPFFRFMFTDCVARQQRENPIVRAFSDALEALSAEYNLSANERELLMLHLAGLTNSVIADQLGRSIKAIEKRWRSIFAKTGTTTARELFASFFTPLHAVSNAKPPNRPRHSKK